MTETVTQLDEDQTLVAPKRVAASKLASRNSLSRENRWKRRGQKSRLKLVLLAIGCLLGGFLAAAFLSPKANTMHNGLDGPFANAIYEAFPEADPTTIETWYEDDTPGTATLHLPAYMIEPAQGIGNPFARLGVEFGGVERTLSGVEMASRLEQIGDAVLPADMVRCHSYEIGGISSEPDALRLTRTLHLHLNPGC